MLQCPVALSGMGIPGAGSRDAAALALRAETEEEEQQGWELQGVHGAHGEGDATPGAQSGTWKPRDNRAEETRFLREEMKPLPSVLKLQQMISTSVLEHCSKCRASLPET